MYKRKWYCKTHNSNFEEHVYEKPKMPQSDSCRECAVKRERAKWVLIEEEK